MDSDSVLINVRQVHEHLHALHLVGHLGLSALTVDGLLEGCAAVLGASVVLDIHQIASLSHVHLPSAELCHVCVLDHLRMRASVYIYDYRIFL